MPRLRLREAAATLLVALLATGLTVQALAEPVLVKVVLVSRHGVRSPTSTGEALQAATGRTWPEWPVGPGELTERGKQDLALMGDYLRGRYTVAGVLPEHACPPTGDVQVWADSSDHRTRQSGDILAQALAPGCGVVSAHDADGAKDPMFDGAAVCPIDQAAAVAAIQARAGGDLVGPAASAVEATRALLGPDACKTVEAACLSGPTSLVAGRSEPKLIGPLGVAAGISENLLLEYTDGMAPAQVAWGHGGAQTLVAVMPAHERSAELMRRTPYIAGHNGFVMARTVMDLLQDRAQSDPRAPSLSPQARLTMFAGHDTNLSNMAGVFGLDWTLPGQPDSTAPDTTLAFELWRETATGALSVRARIYYQSLDQLRDAAPLTAAHPAGVIPVAFSGCLGPNGACPLAELVHEVSAQLPLQCFSTTPPSSLSANIKDTP